ncbi:hypothetical protein RvY_13470 [Ramazzottius varieornatus]|uniref:Cyclic nucleotide-binding domain-containing protein n=1 Tax=Ramazzottius varieornatus TaxID=947166 RepID=A0A1D1VN05_RAMVA|nr:hypothetical protein RvY_13470 [Ramazzottius varieornatus]
MAGNVQDVFNKLPPEVQEVVSKFLSKLSQEKVSKNQLADYALKYFTKSDKKGKKGEEWWDDGKSAEWKQEDEAVANLPEVSPEIKSRRRGSVSAEVFDPAKVSYGPLPVTPKSPQDTELLTKVCRDVFLFRALDNNSLQKVIAALHPVSVERGQNVIRQGDSDEKANEFYIIENGNYDIFVKDGDGLDQKVGEYPASGSFGELALMYNQARAATVTATTAGKLWALDRKTFQQVVLGAAFRKREKYLKIFEKVDFFSELKGYEKSNLCDALIPKSYKAKEKIIVEGDAQAEGMYIVQVGEVQVTKMINGKEKDLGKLGAGSYFGELALVTSKPRAATVRAVKDVELAFLNKGAFERLLGPCMDILKRNKERYDRQMTEIFGNDQPKK